MKVGCGCCALLTLGMVACSVSPGTVTVSGDNPNAMRNAPVGVATLVFMDLEAIRPDVLANAGATLPAGITKNTSSGVTTYTFTNFVAANTGTVSGDVQVTSQAIQGGVNYTEVFNNVTVTTQVAATAATPATTQVWSYNGTQFTSVTGTTATVTVAAPLTADFTDSATPANNKNYTFAPDLTETWNSGDTNLTLTGSYTFGQVVNGVTVATLTGTMNPGTGLVWTSACDYPGTGTLNIALTDLVNSKNDSSASVTFGPACGTVLIDGVNLNLGNH